MITGDSQLRWSAPRKARPPGTAAVVNAVWDLYAKAEGKPLWKLLADMTPEQLVSCIDSDTSPTPSRRRSTRDSPSSADKGGARSRTQRRISGVHDLGRLARLFR